MLNILKRPEKHAENPFLTAFIQHASKIILSKELQLRLAWTCITAGGHLLIEDRPGMGKTTLVKVIAHLLDLPWKRIQCTSDLLPADITGGSVFDQSKQAFVFHPGPLFTNLVMADELNRASPKSQSAFLQSMEEASVTIDGESHQLPRPFVMIATQNSLDSAGTNPLPESQMDRFMIALSLGIPERSSERLLLTQTLPADRIKDIAPVIQQGQLNIIRDEVARVHLSDRVADYILDLATWLRERTDGFSPRTAVALSSCARAWAHGLGRDYVIPEDVQAVFRPVLNHRLRASIHGDGAGVSSILDQALQAVSPT